MGQRRQAAYEPSLAAALGESARARPGEIPAVEDHDTVSWAAWLLFYDGPEQGWTIRGLHGQQSTTTPAHPGERNQRSVKAAQLWAVEVIAVLEANHRDECAQRGYPEEDPAPAVTEWRRIRVDGQLGYAALRDTTEVCATPFTGLATSSGSRCRCITEYGLQEAASDGR